MNFVFVLVSVSVATAFRLWPQCLGGQCTDRCRCEGSWQLNLESYTDHEGGALKPMTSPVRMDVWSLEDGDAQSLRLSLHVGNTLGVVIRATARDFCDKSVEVSGGTFSTRLFAFGAAAQNEKRLSQKLLDALDSWDCQPDVGLTLASPAASAQFIPVDLVAEA